jgi:hypothetical protein
MNNFLKTSLNILLGSYHTPKKIIAKINIEHLIINPPFKQDGYIK